MAQLPQHKLELVHKERTRR